MNHVIASGALLDELGELTEPVALCGDDGQPLGFVVPSANRQRNLYDWAKQEFTDEEIQKARAETGGMTTAEILRGLRP
jgi:hypothetical protein